MLLLMKEVCCVCSHSMGIYKDRKSGLEQVVNEGQGETSSECRGRRRFLYDSRLHTTELPCSSTTLGLKKQLRLGRHPRLHFSASQTSNRAAHDEAHQTIASSSRASLRSRGVAGRLRIHRLATPEGGVGKDATHPKHGHRADMSALEGMRRWMWSFLLLCPSSLIRNRARPLAAQRKSHRIDPGEARRRESLLRTSFFHRTGGTCAVAPPHQH